MAFTFSPPTHNKVCMHAPNPLAKTLGSWLLLVFALVMSSTAWAQRDDGQYQILQAVYGTDQSSIDVTDRLKQLAARDQRFKLTNDLFNNVDPAPGQRKMLRIHARGPDGQPRTFDYIEYSWVDGAQFLGWSTGRWGQRGDNMGRQAVEPTTRVAIKTSCRPPMAPAHRVDVTQRSGNWCVAINVSAEQRSFQCRPSPRPKKTLQSTRVATAASPMSSSLRKALDRRGTPHEHRAGQWNQRWQAQHAATAAMQDGRVTVQRASMGTLQVDVTARLRNVRDGRLQVSVDSHLRHRPPPAHARA
jgi:hypothetical protein